MEREVSILAKQPNQVGLKEFFRTLLTNSAERNRRIVGEVMEAVEQSSHHRQEAGWMRNLQLHFPGDIGVLSPILLNLVRLKPGEAMYLPAGELHAYLEGVGIELMANSDNVLRGGLTTKHIDVKELLHVLTFESREVEVLSPTALSSGENLYHTPAEEFSLSSIDLRNSRPFTSKLDRSVEILLCTQGETIIRSLPDGRTLELIKGDSVLVPSATEQYRLEGEATLFRASVP
jgi:mannose-6-phosphate isomerase